MSTGSVVLTIGNILGSIIVGSIESIGTWAVLGVLGSRARGPSADKGFRPTFFVSLFNVPMKLVWLLDYNRQQVSD